MMKCMICGTQFVSVTIEGEAICSVCANYNHNKAEKTATLSVTKQDLEELLTRTINNVINARMFEQLNSTNRTPSRENHKWNNFETNYLECKVNNIVNDLSLKFGRSKLSIRYKIVRYLREQGVEHA